MQIFLQDWFLAAFASTLVIGIHMALFKLPSVRSFSKYQLTTFSSLLATIFAGIYIYPSIRIEPGILLASFLWAFFYLAVTISQMKSLEYIESSSIFPFTSLLSNIFVVIIGVVFWNDHFTLIQIIAIIVAFIIFFFHSYRGKLSFRTIILPLFLFIAISSTVAKNLQKYGSVISGDDIGFFVFWSMFFLFVLSLIVGFARERKKLFQMHMSKGNIFFIALFWLLQFLAALLMTSWLAHGPLSLVYIINGFYVFITVATCVLFFGEKITKKQVILMVLSFFTILAIKLGGT